MLEDIKAKLAQWRSASWKVTIPVMILLFIFTGIGRLYLNMSFDSISVLINGNDVVLVTNINNDTRIVGKKYNCEDLPNGKKDCGYEDVTRTVRVINYTLNSGNGLEEQGDNFDNDLFLKWDTKDVAAVSSKLASNYKAGHTEISLAVMRSTGFRQGLPDWIQDGGINRNIIEMYKLRTDLTETPDKQTMVEIPAWWNLGFSIWAGIIFWFLVSLLVWAMPIRAYRWSKGSINMAQFLAPVPFPNFWWRRIVGTFKRVTGRK